MIPNRDDAEPSSILNFIPNWNNSKGVANLAVELWVDPGGERR